MSATGLSELRELGLALTSYSMLLSARDSVAKVNVQLKAAKSPIRFEVVQVPAETGESAGTTR